MICRNQTFSSFLEIIVNDDYFVIYHSIVYCLSFHKSELDCDSSILLHVSLPEKLFYDILS